MKHRKTAQKMKFSFKDFFGKCDQIRSFLWICSYLLNKSLIENSIFCVATRLCTRLFLHKIDKNNFIKPELGCASRSHFKH